MDNTASGLSSIRKSVTKEGRGREGIHVLLSITVAENFPLAIIDDFCVVSDSSLNLIGTFLVANLLNVLATGKQ